MISIVRGARERRGGVFADVDAARTWLTGRADCTGSVGWVPSPDVPPPLAA